MFHQRLFTLLSSSVGVAALLLWLPVTPGALAQTKLETKRITPTGVSGAEMYKAYCASCHGADGKGQGPASKALKVPATDLTKIAQRNKGVFNKDRIAMSLGVMPESGAHGTTDMPVWGDVFRGSRKDQPEVQLRIGNLVDYLAGIQDPPPAAGAKPKPAAAADAKPGRVPLTSIPMNSGPEMFKAYCASCHGVDGKGAGPVAKNLKAKPTDLTLLAKANGGKFPGNRVMNILGELPGSDAHGSKEMPVWGDALRAVDKPEAVRLRLANITDYVKALQQK